MNGEREILYVAGTARSGSTILSLLLGAAPGVVPVGELTHYFEDALVKQVECSCGCRSRTCEFWESVRIRAGFSPEKGAELHRLSKSVDHHAGLPRHLFGSFRSEIQERYRRIQGRLIRALWTETGVRTLVDSSKYAARALTLDRWIDARLRVLVLVRDPRGMISSFRKRTGGQQKHSSEWFGLVYYPFVTTSLRVMLGRLRCPTFVMSYSELAESPVESLRQIERWADLDLSKARRRLQKTEPFEPGHLLTGNRLRKQERIVFRPETDVDLESVSAKLVATGLNGWGRLLGFV